MLSAAVVSKGYCPALAGLHGHYGILRTTALRCRHVELDLREGEVAQFQAMRAQAEAEEERKAAEARRKAEAARRAQQAQQEK